MNNFPVDLQSGCHTAYGTSEFTQRPEKVSFDKNKMTADKMVNILSDDQFAIGALDVESEYFDLRN